MVDFNSFFASVEQQLQPKLRHRPIAVVPMLTDSTCCIAASYEAKAFGIKTGTNVGEAKKLCPGLIIVEAQPAHYIEFHEKLVAAVESCLHVDRILSIDEMCGTLTGKWQQPEQARALALQIKKCIYEKVGAYLRCSIGIAPNPFLAKTATDMQKPDGLVLIDLPDLPHILHPLELRDLCGIGHNIEERLRRHGLHTVAQLCAASPGALRRVWGSVEGERFHDRLRGLLVEDIPTNKSVVGHSHVLPPKLRHAEGAHAVLYRLLQKAAARLRRIGYLAGSLQLSLSFRDHPGWSEDLHFRETSSTLELLRILDQLWARRPTDTPPPHKVAVSLSHLVNAQAYTPSLFHERTLDPKLDRAMDRLNECYGKNTVFFGGAYHAQESAALRIAFNHIPELINSEMD